MENVEDLRNWIEQAEKAGELAVIKGADPKFEIGAANQLNSKNQGPAILYEQIKGLPPDARLLTNLLSNTRTFNLAFSLPVTNTIRETVRALSKRVPQWEATAGNFPPKTVATGHITENFVTGDDIDLTKFPAPVWHELDGGPYIGTGHGIVTRDPETGHINFGSYRCQLFDRRSIGMNSVPGKHGRIHRDKYFKRGEPCPAVAVLGLHPLMFAIAASNIAQQTCEFDFVGAVQGNPISVIKGKVTGLPIPAYAEIAVEGFLDPVDTKIEGPFGEFTGYYGSGETKQPYIRAETVYYRNQPIITGSSPAKGSYCDEAFFRSVWQSALLYNQLVGANVGGIKGVWWTPYMEVIAIEQQYTGHATQVGHVAAQCGAGAISATHRYTIVVDGDVDPTSLEDVMWAVCTRSSPAAIDIIKEAWSSPTDPIIRHPADSYATSRAIIYAVKPFSWRDRFPPVTVASEKLRNEVFEKWGSELRNRWHTI